MPLPQPANRKEVHQRTIDMKAYERDDGMFDVEAHLVDTKPFEFERVGMSAPVPTGTPLHDLWVRMTVDKEFVVRDICASSDVTPFGICKQAENTLKVLIGERIARGWSSKVKSSLGGTASCTHLKELLIPLATTAMQGIRGVRPVAMRRGVGMAGPVQIDTCYAYDRRREVVQRIWPEHFVSPDGAEAEKAR